MSDILKDSQKEKVLRMIVAAFVNILNNAKESESLLREFTLIMITAKVPRSLELIIETHEKLHIDRLFYSEFVHKFL